MYLLGLGALSDKQLRGLGRERVDERLEIVCPGRQIFMARPDKRDLARILDRDPARRGQLPSLDEATQRGGACERFMTLRQRDDQRAILSQQPPQMIAHRVEVDRALGVGDDAGDGVEFMRAVELLERGR